MCEFPLKHKVDMPLGRAIVTDLSRDGELDLKDVGATWRNNSRVGQFLNLPCSGYVIDSS